MIDSHCHLDMCDDPEAAADPSLRALVTVGTTLERSRGAIALAERHANVWAAVGIHPNSASLAQDAVLRRELEELARHPKVVAIGETGFDRYWQDETPEAQQFAFDWQAELAAALDKALVLHVRDPQGEQGAAAQATRAITAAGHRRGVLHCFSGQAELLGAGLALGWMVSFAGNLTYRGAEALRQSAGELPQDCLLVETDSPFLTPVPKRGERNLPANVRLTAAVLAAARGVALNDLEPVLDANATRLFGLPQNRLALGIAQLGAAG